MILWLNSHPKETELMCESAIKHAVYYLKIIIAATYHWSTYQYIKGEKESLSLSSTEELELILCHVNWLPPNLM